VGVLARIHSAEITKPPGSGTSSRSKELLKLPSATSTTSREESARDRERILPGSTMLEAVS
jgi:hypothetical protein